MHYPIGQYVLKIRTPWQLYLTPDDKKLTLLTSKRPYYYLLSLFIFLFTVSQLMFHVSLSYLYYSRIFCTCKWFVTCYLYIGSIKVCMIHFSVGLFEVTHSKFLRFRSLLGKSRERRNERKESEIVSIFFLPCFFIFQFTLFLIKGSDT